MNLHKDFNKEVIRLVLILVLVSGLCAVSNAVYSAEPLRDYKDEKLKTLVTGLNPAVYLNGSGINIYGPGTSRVVYTDAAYVATLYGQRTEFGTVELIEIRLKSAADESTRLDITRLNGFDNLKYILLTYEYNACTGSNDACLDEKTSLIVTNRSDNPVTILYRLSIPE